MTAPVRLPSRLAEQLIDQLADIGDRVRAERQARGLSRSELARSAHVGKSALARLEFGRPTLTNTLLLVARALDMDAGHLLSAQWRPPKGRPLLSPRQLLVLRAAASGDSLAALGEQLGMTASTVSSHLSQIYVRLDVTHAPRGHRRSAAVRVARRHGWIDAACAEQIRSNIRQATDQAGLSSGRHQQPTETVRRPW